VWWKQQFSMLKTVQNIWTFGFFPVTNLFKPSFAGWGVAENV
jgi:hypothetical protein